MHPPQYMKPSMACLLFLTVIWIAPVQATSVSYFLDKNNAGLTTDSYLKVTISENVSGIDFRVEILGAAFAPLNPGDNFGMDKFYFNFDDSLISLTANNITNLSPESWKVKLDKNAGGGFGKFEFETSGNGYSRTDLLTFSIIDVVGDTPWTYAILGDANEFFAAHVGGFNAAGGVGSAKFAGSTLVPIPLPAALWFFGPGLIGLLSIARRKGSKGSEAVKGQV